VGAEPPVAVMGDARAESVGRGGYRWRVGAVSSCGLGAGETVGGGTEVQASGPLGDGKCDQPPNLAAGAGEPG
jgi:hypothetical protein